MRKCFFYRCVTKNTVISVPYFRPTKSNNISLELDRYCEVSLLYIELHRKVCLIYPNTNYPG